jgi:D-alanyl-lipoteichoic acid acyltransferase DltB (MBOAT superfamily)
VIRWIGERYQRYEESYKAYVRLRGYGDHLNDWPFFRRSFLTCWAEPGFHRFWRVWNPGISYFVFRLYLAFGGKRNRVLATLGAFEICGIAHVLCVYLLLRRWSLVLPAAFLCFGILALVSRALEHRIRQERWPAAVNVVVNVGMVIVSYDIGFRLDRLLRAC